MQDFGVILLYQFLAHRTGQSFRILRSKVIKCSGVHPAFYLKKPCRWQGQQCNSLATTKPKWLGKVKGGSERTMATKIVVETRIKLSAVISTNGEEEDDHHFSWLAPQEVDGTSSPFLSPSLPFPPKNPKSK